MQIGSVVWEEFYHIHTYIHTYTRNLANVALSIRVTLITKPASQVLTSCSLLLNPPFPHVVHTRHTHTKSPPIPGLVHWTVTYGLNAEVQKLALGWTYSRNKGRKGKEGTPLPHTVIILSVNYSHHAVVKILINFPTHPTHTIIIVIIKAAVTDLTATQPLCVHNLISVQPPHRCSTTTLSLLQVTHHFQRRPSLSTVSRLILHTSRHFLLIHSYLVIRCFVTVSFPPVSQILPSTIGLPEDCLHRLGLRTDLFWVDLIKWMSNVRLSVRPSVRPYLRTSVHPSVHRKFLQFQ